MQGKWPRCATRAASPRAAVALQAVPVHRAWDLGVGNDTSIWWFQMRGAQLVILDHYATSGVGVEHYADVIEQRKAAHGWLDGTDFVPHDANVKEWGTGRTRIETMGLLGLHPSRCRWRRSTTASRRCAAPCRCACFIRAAKTAAFRRSSSIAANGTMIRSAFGRPPTRTGRPTLLTLFDTWRRLGSRRRSAASSRQLRPAGPSHRFRKAAGAASFYKHATQRNFAQQGASRMQQSPFMDLSLFLLPPTQRTTPTPTPPAPVTPPQPPAPPPTHPPPPVLLLREDP